MVAIELGAIIVLLPLIGVTDQNHGVAFAMVAVLFVLVAVGLIPMVAALVALLFNSRRMGRALRRHPWVSWPAEFKVVPRGEGAVEALFLGPDQMRVLVVNTGLRRHNRLKDLSEIWLAGTPEAGGVVSPPGGAYVLRGRRPARRLEHELMEHRPVNNPGSPPDRESGDLT
jgi:hypothetical protein